MSKASPDQLKRVIHRNRRTKAQIALDAERAAAEVVAALQNGADPVKVLNKLRTRPEREAATAALAAWQRSNPSSAPSQVQNTSSAQREQRPQKAGKTRKSQKSPRSPEPSQAVESLSAAQNVPVSSPDVSKPQKRPYHRVIPTLREQLVAANQRAEQAEANARAAEARVSAAEHRATAGGVFDLSEVAVLLHALHKHWLRNGHPQAGTLQIEFLTPTGRQKTALKVLLPDGHIYLDDFGTTSDVVVKRSLESILRRFTTHQPSAYPERIGGNIHRGGPTRYAWLRVRSGCFIIGYAADYGAAAQGSHCSSESQTGRTLAFVVTLLSQFAAARGDLPAPFLKIKNPDWSQDAVRLDRDFSCLATPELYAWNDWCLKTKPGPYRIA